MTLTSHSQPSPAAPGEFEVDAPRILRDLRTALAAVVEGVSPGISRPADLQRALALDKALGWNVYTAAMSSDPMTLAGFAPGTRAMAKFFTAARTAGCPERVVADAERAFAEFESLIERHAGDRDAFAAMVGALGDGDDGRAVGSARRAAFKANALVVGRQARACVECFVIHPAADGSGRVDTAIVDGSMDLRLTRRSAPPRIHKSVRRKVRAGDDPEPVRLAPLDPGPDGANPVGLLADFCSRPLPEIATTSIDDAVLHEIVARGVGNAGMFTFFKGHHLPAATSFPRTPGAVLDFAYDVSTPAELVVIDALIHDSLWDDTPPEVTAFLPTIGWDRPIELREKLPMAERAVHLGRGVDGARTPELPRHAELLAHVLHRRNWSPDRMHAFRFRTEFPVLFSRLSLAFRR